MSNTLTSDFLIILKGFPPMVNTFFCPLYFATTKVKGSINAGQLNSNLKETVRSIVCEDKGYSFMKAVKGTPAY